MVENMPEERPYTHILREVSSENWGNHGQYPIYPDNSRRYLITRSNVLRCNIGEQQDT